jgi:hypothetical protein
MAFKLTKSQLAQRTTLVTELRAKADSLAATITAYNVAMVDVAKAVNDATVAYNACIETAREFAAEVATEAQVQFDENSEQWQEGTKGTAAAEWIQEWENVDLEDVELDDVEPLPEIDASEIAGLLEDLPTGV